MPLDEHSPVEQRVFSVLKDFVDAFSEYNAPAHLDEVLRDGKYMKPSELGQMPERFVEDHLIWDTLEALGYEHIPRPYRPNWDKTIPDFAVTNLEFDFEFKTVGEVKTLNKFEDAEEDVVDYLHKDLKEHAIAFATDGLDWKVYFRSRKTNKVHPVSEAYLGDTVKPLLKRYMENEEVDSHRLRKKMSGIEDLTKQNLEEYIKDRVERESWET